MTQYLESPMQALEMQLIGTALKFYIEISFFQGMKKINFNYICKPPDE